MMSMPGTSYSGPFLPLDSEETALRASLEADVKKLAEEIGERNVFLPEKLRAAAEHIESSFARAGCKVRVQELTVEGTTCRNIEAAVPGGSLGGEIVVVGGHYDSVAGSPGANDNATGAAAVLALARAFAGKRPARTLRFVAFVNEEPPFFQTDAMGSVAYARECRARSERIVAMLSLETMGFYSDVEGTQSYPFPFGRFYPSRGDFIAFVGNLRSRALVRRVVETFRRHAKFPSEGAAVPGIVQGASWSDHWSFWKEGYPAVMVTDTAPFRYAHYHTAMDTPDKISFDHLARLVKGLEEVVAELAGPGP